MADLYQIVLQIADRFQVPAHQFESIRTTERPGHPNERVFYPFHILSRSQARAVAWDWTHVYSFAKEELRTLRIACDHHAEKAGLGEKEVDQETLIYWMTAFYCRKIRPFKASTPTPAKMALLSEWLTDGVSPSSLGLGIP